MNTRLLPALPAEGFVRFGLAGSVETGAEVPAGTPLLADAQDAQSGTAVFETADDVFVTPAEPEQIFTVCGGADVIARCFDAGSEDRRAFSLFDLRAENLQRHALYLAQETVLEISGGASISVELTPGHQRELPAEVGRALTDPARVVWEYSCGQSWQSFSACALDGNCVRLELEAHKLPLTAAVQEGLEERRWVRLRLLPGAQVPELSLRQIRLAAENRELPADQVNASGTDQNIHGGGDVYSARGDHVGISERLRMENAGDGGG